MATTVTWQGSNLELQAHISGSYLFLASETSLTVDSRRVARSGGFRFTESASGRFTGRDGLEHAIELQTMAGPFTLTLVPYVVRVDGIVISQGSLVLEGIALAFVAYGLVIGLVIIVLLVVAGAIRGARGPARGQEPEGATVVIKMDAPTTAPLLMVRKGHCYTISATSFDDVEKFTLSVAPVLGADVAWPFGRRSLAAQESAVVPRNVKEAHLPPLGEGCLHATSDGMVAIVITAAEGEGHVTYVVHDEL